MLLLFHNPSLLLLFLLTLGKNNSRLPVLSNPLLTKYQIPMCGARVNVAENICPVMAVTWSFRLCVDLKVLPPDLPKSFRPKPKLPSYI